jgi:hypothetical protein
MPVMAYIQRGDSIAEELRVLLGERKEQPACRFCRSTPCDNSSPPNPPSYLHTQH